MRKLIMAVATATTLGLGATSGTVAAPVPGFEGLYSTLIASCSLPDGTEAACEAAITAYADALVAAGVDIEVANQSFSEARQEVLALNGGDVTFQAAIDALFELLLPDSGAIGGTLPAPEGGPGPEGTSGTPVPSSPVT